MKVYLALFFIHSIGISALFSKDNLKLNKNSAKLEVREVKEMKEAAYHYENHYEPMMESQLNWGASGMANGLFNKIQLKGKGFFSSLFSSVEVRSVFGLAYGECSSLRPFLKKGASNCGITLSQNKKQRTLLYDFIDFLIAEFKEEQEVNMLEYITLLQKIQLAMIEQEISQFNQLSESYVEKSLSLSAHHKKAINSFLEERGAEKFFQED